MSDADRAGLTVLVELSGGVARHVEALAEQFGSEGHYVRVLAPLDPPGRLTSLSHRGTAPEPVSVPAYLVPLGRTVSHTPVHRRAA